MAAKQDECIAFIPHLQNKLKTPKGIAKEDIKAFICFAGGFFTDQDHIWKCNSQGAHKLYIPPGHCTYIMQCAHNNLGHKGLHPTCVLISERFWWPCMFLDIDWFVKSLSSMPDPPVPLRF
ncbi:hypothetical protein BD779DRAFT_611215 [Infundibulicybe gibba]|nr:hypothetical protein BD779DRAFT_611215 [Infundibulicybe gibba]